MSTVAKYWSSDSTSAGSAPRLSKGQKANKKRMATVAAVFTRAPWVRTPQQVVESLFRISRPTPEDAPAPQRPENKRVWASLLKGKNAVIQEVAEEMERRDPAASKTRVALTDGERALQIRVDRNLKVTLILDLMHALEKLWKAAYVFHAEGSLEADLWVLDRTLRVLSGDVGQVGASRAARLKAADRVLSHTKITGGMEAIGLRLRAVKRTREALKAARPGKGDGAASGDESRSARKAGHGAKFGRRKEEAIVALLTQRNVEEAARVVPVGTTTLYRWMKDAEFAASSRAARLAAFGQASARLQQASGAAAAVIVKMMVDPGAPAGTRVRAADLV